MCSEVQCLGYIDIVQLYKGTKLEDVELMKGEGVVEESRWKTNKRSSLGNYNCFSPPPLSHLDRNVGGKIRMQSTQGRFTRKSTVEKAGLETNSGGLIQTHTHTNKNQKPWVFKPFTEDI